MSDPTPPPPPPEPEAGYCAQCGSPHAAGAVYCSSCGARVGQAASSPMPPAPGYAPVYVQQKTSGYAIAGLVLGIIWIYWIGSVLALVFGYVAKSQIDKSQGALSGRGMAIAAIVLGWIGVATLIFVIVLVAIGATSAPG